MYDIEVYRDDKGIERLDFICCSKITQMPAGYKQTGGLII